MSSQLQAPAALSQEKLNERLSEPQGRSGRIWRRYFCILLGSQHRTVQAVAGLYTDYPIPTGNRNPTFRLLTLLIPRLRSPSMFPFCLKCQRESLLLLKDGSEVQSEK